MDYTNSFEEFSEALEQSIEEDIRFLVLASLGVLAFNQSRIMKAMIDISEGLSHKLTEDKVDQIKSSLNLGVKLFCLYHGAK